MDRKKILLVEDDQFTRELYEEVLTEAGYEVTTATNGEEGLNHIKNGGYDLIFLDVMMPKKDGLQVLRALKEEAPKTVNGGIILLTNLSNDPVFNSAYGLNVGVADHLVKSDITPGDLVEKVKKYFQEAAK